VLESMLIFLRNALHYQDTRSCATAVRALRPAIPQLPLDDPQKGPVLRHFLCDEMLKAAITSLHEPYFVSVQQYLAGLIGHLLTLPPGHEGDHARTVLLSLPGLTDRVDKVDRVLGKLRPQATRGSDRHVISTVLDLLKDVRGLSIQEQGRIVPERGPGSGNASSASRKSRSKFEENMMKVDESASAGGIGAGGEDALAGVADMFLE
jgi:exportin-5